PARPVRTAEPCRSMSSEEGGVGSTRSSSVRRWRESRAGVLRPTIGSAARDFRAVRILTFFWGEAFRAFAAFRGEALRAFAAIFGLEARRALVGRLAERAGRLVFFAILRVGFRPLLFRLAMAVSPLRNLDSFTLSVVLSAAYRKSASPDVPGKHAPRRQPVRCLLPLLLPKLADRRTR